MKHNETTSKETQLVSKEKPELNDAERREFIRKYGPLAVITPVALAAIMSPKRAMAQTDSAGF